MKLKLLIAATLLAQYNLAFAGQITSSSDSALNGASIIDFGSASQGEYDSLTLNNVTFSTLGDERLYISNAYAGSYNTQGQSLQNTYAANAFNMLNITFGNAVSAFGFNYGASDVEWTLSAFDTSNNLVDSMILPVLSSSNNGEFYGLSGSSISYATLTSSGTGDYIFMDNFAVAAVPEPSTYALMLGGLGMVGFLASRKRRSSSSSLTA